MRKKIISCLCAIIFALPLFGGCGCSSLNALAFTTAFYGEGSSAPAPGYKETLVYDVVYENSQDYFKKDSSVKDDVLTFEFTDGKYVSVLEVLSSKPQEIATDIALGADFAVYKLSTELSVHVKYKVAAGEFERTDSIKSVSYFYSGALAPLYSETTSSYTNVYLGQKEATLRIFDSESKIFYNSSEYTVKKDFVNYDFADDTDEKRPTVSGTNFTEKTYEYESRTVIDNAELLFALRNVVVEEEKSISVPTVAAAYGESKPLSVRNKAQNERTVKITVNGEEKEENIKVNNLSYSVAAKNESGASQTAVIQASGTAIPNKAFLILYAEPLIAQNSAVKLGTLLYTLKEATFG